MKRPRVRPSSQKNEKYEKVRGKTTITEKNVPGSWFSVVVSCCSLIIIIITFITIVIIVIIIYYYHFLLLLFTSYFNILYFCFGDAYHMLVKRVKSNKIESCSSIIIVIPQV